MAGAAIHLIKLCVGAEGPDALALWQKARSAERAGQGLDPRPRHTTRAAPKRAQELLEGGSLYWVFRGAVRARQRLEAIEPVTGDDGATRHDLVLNPQIVLTHAQPRRAFQGWRYLRPEDAPVDLSADPQEGADLPPQLREQLALYGVI